MMQFLVGEGELFLGPADFIDQFTLVKGLLGDHLASEVLDLSVQTLLDCIVLLAHDVPPDGVQIVENLADTLLSHLAMEPLLDGEDGPDSLCWDPVVVLLSLEAGLTL